MKTRPSRYLEANINPSEPRGHARIAIAVAKCLGLSVGMAAVFALSPDARADERFWEGDTDQNWSNPLNWSGDTFPNGRDVDAIINTPTGNYPIISADPTSGTPRNIIVGNGGGNSGRLDQTAGAASTGSGNWLMVGANSGNGTFNIANTAATGGTFTGYGQEAGSFTAGRINVGGGQAYGSGTGTLNINTTGTITATRGDNQAGIQVGVESTSIGTINLDGGTLNGGDDEIWIGKAGQGTLNQSGGTVTNTSYFNIGRDSTSIGLYNLAGGTVNASINDGTTVSIGGSGGASGTLSVSGTGEFNSTTSGMIVGEGWQGSGTASGTLNLSGGGLVDVGTSTRGVNLGANGIGSGTVNLDGGTLRTGVVSKGGGTGVFNFNSGTLRATKTNTLFMTGLTSANVLSGGAKVDSNGFDITIGQALLHGGTGTDGGLIKSGTGTLTLTGANTFTGAVVINEGTLYANRGNAPSNQVFSTVSSITVNSGATLRTADNSLFGYDGGGSGAQFRPITINGGTMALDSGISANVNVVTLNGGTISGTGSTQYGGFAFGRFNGTGATLAVTNDSTFSSTNATFRNDATINVSTGKTLAFTGTIINTDDGVSLVTKNGAGTLILTGANTYTGATTINAGTLVAGAAGALGSGTTGTSSITVNTGGTLLLSGSGALDRIKDTAAITLAGGTFDSGTFSEGASNGTTHTTGMGALTLSSNSTLNFGTSFDSISSVFAFADSSVATWTGTLTLTNFVNGTATGTTGDFLNFNNLGLTSNQLAQITFTDGSGNSFSGSGFNANGDVTFTPVPEPATVIGGIALLGLIGYHERRRLASAFTRILAA